MLLTSLALTRSNQSSIEPRIGISNNDCTVKFYDVPLRAQNKRVLDQVGGLTLDVPVNHCTWEFPRYSISYSSRITFSLNIA